MSFKSKFLRVSMVSMLVGLLSFTTLADTIRLKDGSRVKGKIVSFGGGRFVVAVGDGARRRQMSVAVDEVESIDFDAPQPEMVAANRNISTVKVADATSPARANNNPPPPRVTAQPRTQPEPEVIEESEPPAVETNKKVSYAKPVEIPVKVLGDNTANGWTNSGYVVKKGQRIRISGSGEVSLGRGRTTSPSGLYDLEDGEKLLKSVPTGALIAVIGDDNNEFIYIGAEREFTAARDGILFLGVNEGNLGDNSGSFNVKVEISPNGGE